MTVLTGPNASSSWGSARLASSQRRSSGEMNAPRCSSAPTTATRSGSPKTSLPAARSDFTERRTSSRCSKLARAPIRTDSSAGLPTDDLFQSRSRRVDDLIQLPGWDERPADRRTFLSGLHGHLRDQLLDEQVELDRARRGVRAKDRAVERVCFGIETHRARHDVTVRPQLLRGQGGASEAQQVLLTEMIQQVAGAAAEQLYGARGHDPGLLDQLDQSRGQVSSLRGRLDQGRHPCDQCGG